MNSDNQKHSITQYFNKMHEKAKIKNKIDLLLISIEALDQYLWNNIFSSKYKDKINEGTIMFKIRCNNLNIHPKYNQKCEFRHATNSMSRIYEAITNQSIQNTAQIILTSYIKNKPCKLTSQYIRRFGYIYKKTQSFYIDLSYNTYSSIKEKAIINLYIFNKISQEEGFYGLIKYLDLNK
uniref:Uncharacterized protein n=1 Tax=Rhodymenia pseudopalmata TaxID=31502 RepID=A0A1C9C7S3_RHOPU|nr:hypothetical protein Rhodyp_143 [Rhodymenia pseudopalmata]AOM64421.1 hypothetical protein Rhodyp_143 [Rhodymenia pseudopalmata]